MALDKLVDSIQLDNNLTSVANAIRAKSGGTGQLAFPAGFVSEIGNISGGGGITPTGTKEITITTNGTTTEDVTNYASAQITVNVPTGGGNSIYLSQYTPTGDTTISAFLNSINYSVHSNNCLIIIRSNGTTAPETGSYTINNFIAGFKNGTLVNGSDMYVNKKAAPNTMATFPQFNEKSDKFYLDNGVLKNSYNGVNCLAGAGSAVTLAEIDLPNNFWDVLTAETIL